MPLPLSYLISKKIACEDTNNGEEINNWIEKLKTLLQINIFSAQFPIFDKRFIKS
jgi:hypothetical protein